MRKPDLAAAIADKADLSKDQANRVLNAVLDEITKALSEKDSVTLVVSAPSCSATVAPVPAKILRLAHRSRSRPATPFPSNPAKACATPSTDSAV